MIRFAYATFYGIVVQIVQVILIEALFKVDNDVNERCTKLDKAIIVVQSILAECWIAILTPMDAYHLSIWIQSQLFIVLFEVQSCVDNKIKQVYDLLSYIMIAYAALNMTVFHFSELYDRGNIIIQAERVVPVILILILIQIITAFNGIGKGDTLIYIALGIHYITYADIPWFVMIIGFFISCQLFTLSNAIDGIRNKNIQKHKPFTMFISIAAVFTFA